MRGLRIALLLHALLLQGCFVFDELDKSDKLMRKTSASAQKQAGAAKSNANSQTAEKAPSWWEGATTFAPGEGDESIVGCQLSGSIQFMRESDCLTRGGRPQRS
jgi:hypothetical protein